MDGPGKNGGSATKTAKNVDGPGKNGGSATKTAKNVDEKKMPGQSRASWNKTGRAYNVWPPMNSRRMEVGGMAEISAGWSGTM